MMEQMTEVILDNGMKVHLMEIHTAPIVSHWVWYRVGSRYETSGKTGISHWVEHMQFKGTPLFPAGVLDRAISRDGGIWNAFTYMDWTTFFETMPAAKIDLALKLESDRMVNSRYDPAEVASERTVVISEREGNENEPLFRLDEAVEAASFNTHPYRNEVIGSIADLHAIQRDDLYQHYRKYYNPANAVLAIAGDFETRAMLDRIGDIYGKLPGTPVAALEIPLEAPLNGEKRIEVRGPGETTYLNLSYRAPAASDPDFFAVSVLDSLFTGPSSLNMFGGGGISNKTSRLYRTLVEKELAVSVNGGIQATKDPYLYSITVTARPEVEPSAIIARIDEETSRLQETLVTQVEIDRAVKQARALFAYGSENITNQGFWLGYTEMFDSYRWFSEYVQRLQAVTPEQVLKAAQKYLSRSSRVVGTYIPEGPQS
jgi:zinc protease